MRIGRAAGSGQDMWAVLPGYGLVLWVLAALACALLPLPRWLVDLLLTASLAGSIIALVASVTARRSAELLGFPRLLLLMTLTRMALNITTTRLILRDADAGEVIAAFSTLVIEDDLLVGAVVFAIVTVVQFVVVARGGERIAEVAARFALDGLPGHQAAIEADLRAGAISAAEASRLRARLHERSNFYGAMDGAAKFIRGDAILGLVLTSINVVGGLAVGLRDGLGLGASLELYGRLAIGDGLLAQVPALLVGLAGALLIARVDREEPATRRATWWTPGVVAAPAGLLAGLALAPGMPTAAFLTTAAGLAVLAWGLRRGRAPERRIVVCLPGHDARDIQTLQRPLAELRRRCAGALGLEVPPIVAAPGPAFAVRLGELALAGPEDLPGPARALSVLPDPGERGGVDSQDDSSDRVDRSCSSGHAATDRIVMATFRAVMRGAEALVDLRTIAAALEQARGREPAVTREALAAIGPADLLALVRGLLRERVPLPPFTALLEAVASEPLLRQAGERGRWLEALRERLAPQWVREVVAAHARLGPVTWARPVADAEAALLSRAVHGERGLRLAIDGRARQAWRSRVTLQNVVAGGETEERPPPIVVCSPRARPVFALLLARGAPHVTVLSTAELLEVDLPLPGEPDGPAVRWFEAPALAGGASRGRALPSERDTA
ncbi:FHIPEP family type III secretion protein [Nannocystis radixulma]|uniref:FHIPEP family type III secretion protein n=1 Tax=Nannocystis radixulma TaxID=2995305 RepID=A0ABT5BNV7_9BACT|nr:FHIPEP family type III secretion protein [Nannocystis radixulma]MDC0675849.1 FHIPEP family type III secretion protein [Nannocystis radixulma]